MSLSNLKCANMTRRKTPQSASSSRKLKSKLSQASKPTVPAPATFEPTALPPTRSHQQSYHFPLLLLDDGRTSCDALLRWFEGVHESRSMPWRKQWVDPSSFGGREEELESILSIRAYEVWVSEVSLRMLYTHSASIKTKFSAVLQQTRVSTVIPYFNTWISKWPTIQDLAEANHDQVLSVWKGLGYYSRATRLHEGAKAMISNHSGTCPIPSKADDLQQFPGIGRYTAGAIASIAFGEAEPVLDGNVARVLSRQLGLYVDAKDKKASDFLWDVADQLVKHVSNYSHATKSAVPGMWNQAVMELGSTICTPRPKCDDCPIQKTCRAYAEGEALSEHKQPYKLRDIEDVCSLCEQLDVEDLVTVPDDAEEKDEEDAKAQKKRKSETKQANTISQYFSVKTPSQHSKMDNNSTKTAPLLNMNGSKKRKVLDKSGTPKAVLTYCSLFPKKIVKKKVAEEECVVCVIECRLSDTNSKWLVEQRPAQGLLASLWQFPSCTLLASSITASDRNNSAQKYVSRLDAGGSEMSKARHVAAFDPFVHVFSHLKLTMHVHHFRLDADDPVSLDHPLTGPPARRWVDTTAMDSETLSTGMRRCWELVKRSV